MTSSLDDRGAEQESSGDLHIATVVVNVQDMERGLPSGAQSLATGGGKRPGTRAS